MTTPTNEQLLPCPFCGAPGHITRSEFCGSSSYYVSCTQVDCFCAVGEAYDRDALPSHIFPSEEDAAKAWNTRQVLKGERGDVQELRLIESVLKGYPASIARDDALRAVSGLIAQPPSPRVADSMLQNTIRSAFDMLFEYKDDGQNATHAKRLLRNAICAFDGPELLLSREAHMEKHLAAASPHEVRRCAATQGFDPPQDCNAPDCGCDTTPPDKEEL